MFYITTYAARLIDCRKKNTIEHHPSFYKLLLVIQIKCAYVNAVSRKHSYMQLQSVRRHTICFAITLPAKPQINRMLCTIGMHNKYALCIVPTFSTQKNQILWPWTIDQTGQYSIECWMTIQWALVIGNLVAGYRLAKQVFMRFKRNLFSVPLCVFQCSSTWMYF